MCSVHTSKTIFFLMSQAEENEDSARAITLLLIIETEDRKDKDLRGNSCFSWKDGRLTNFLRSSLKGGREDSAIKEKSFFPPLVKCPKLFKK